MAAMAVQVVVQALDLLQVRLQVERLVHQAKAVMVELQHLTAQIHQLVQAVEVHCPQQVAVLLILLLLQVMAELEVTLILHGFQ
jgi:hypothetical protein